MVVLTLVVMVTLPLTKKKMDKVDYLSYYLGYKIMKDISANVMPDLSSELGCAFEINGTCYGQPFYPAPLTKGECRVQKYKLKINGCYEDNDYWAGAVKTCGGTDKMPTLAQLAEIAQYLYPDITISSPANNYCPNYSSEYYTEDMKCMQDDRVETLGFKNPYDTDPGFYFYVWSGEEWINDGNNYASYQYFFPVGTYWGINQFGRNNKYVSAVCIGANKPTASSLCEKIRDTYNISTSDCSVPVSDVQTGLNSGDFLSLTPHITMSNGLKLYIGSDYEEIAELNDSIDEQDKTGFIIYIDVNGKSGKSKLWEDVFPYYLLRSGKVVPAYNPAINSGATNREHLSINVLYDDYTDDKREVKFLLKDANFHSAACATGYVTSAKYCGGRVQYDLCKETERDCRIQVKTPVKIF